MKRFTYLFSLTIAAFAIAAVGMVGCEGPAGAPGADMDATCKVCHNDKSDLLAKQYQASNSGHQTHSNSGRSGASWDRPNRDPSCISGTAPRWPPNRGAAKTIGRPYD